MTEPALKGRLAHGRDVAQSTIHTLSQSARDVATSARNRIDATYDQARGRVTSIAADGRALAQDGAAMGQKAVKTGRNAVDRAMLSSRDLIAERPVTAVVAGLTAGLVLGFLANRLAQHRKAQAERDAEEEEFTGG